MKHDYPVFEGLSERNIRYCKKFYILYSQVDRILQQVVAKSDGDSQKANLPQVVAELGERPSILEKLCAVPWGQTEWVDRLSLAISLREDEDPRVEGEVERLINEIEWNG